MDVEIKQMEPQSKEIRMDCHSRELSTDKEGGYLEPQEKHGLADTLISDLWPPELRQLPLFEAIQFMVLCYGSPRKLRVRHLLCDGILSCLPLLFT